MSKHINKVFSMIQTELKSEKVDEEFDFFENEYQAKMKEFEEVGEKFGL